MPPPLALPSASAWTGPVRTLPCNHRATREPGHHATVAQPADQDPGLLCGRTTRNCRKMTLHAGFRPAVFDSNGGCLQLAEDTPDGA